MMRTTKLTLSTDKELLREAKLLAAREGTSLSSMFARFLQAILREQSKKARPGPITRRAIGLVKLPAGKSDRELLAEALAERHGL
jgi:hypothetical protein